MESRFDLNSTKRRTLTLSKSVGDSYPYPPSQSQLSQHQIAAYSHQQDAMGSLPKLSRSKSSSWGLDQSELKRRQRVASYKAYSVEGRVKLSFRKGFRWFKDKIFDMRHGWH